MDLATIIGMVMGYLFILGAILYGGSLLIFIDVPSILVVVGGTTSALLYAHPMPAMKAFVSFVKNAFQDRLAAPGAASRSWNAFLTNDTKAFIAGMGCA